MILAFILRTSFPLCISFICHLVFIFSYSTLELFYQAVVAIFSYSFFLVISLACFDLLELFVSSNGLAWLFFLSIRLVVALN